jgi:hypothetical protein
MIIYVDTPWLLDDYAMIFYVDTPWLLNDYSMIIKVDTAWFLNDYARLSMWIRLDYWMITLDYQGGYVLII